MASRVQSGRVRHVLDAARAFIEAHGVEKASSMRRLSEKRASACARSTTTSATKKACSPRWCSASLDSIDVAVHHLAATDPIERIREAITVSIDKTVAERPQGRRARGRHGRSTGQPGERPLDGDLIVSEIGAATEAGVLRADIDPSVLRAAAAASEKSYSCGLPAASAEAGQRGDRRWRAARRGAGRFDIRLLKPWRTLIAGHGRCRGELRSAPIGRGFRLDG